MKKVIPFKKDIEFNTDIFEINSISLEHNLKPDNNQITGDFIISGDYKDNDIALNNEPFIFNLPVTIDLDNYDLSDVKIEIKDFNYDLISNNKLEVDIKLIIDDLKEIEIIDNIPIIEEYKEEAEIKEEPVSDNYITEEEYITYHVHIYRENDSIDSIITKYNISKDDLEEYNNLNDITIGSKIIIPSNE